MGEPKPTERVPLRSRLVTRSFTFGCLLLGGLLAVVSTAQPWWRAAGGGARVVFKGTEASGGLSQALAVVSLAGTLLVLVLRVRGRRVLAVLLALAGLGVVVVGALRLRPTTDAVRTKLAEVSLIDQFALSPTVWPWIFALAGVVVTGGALALLVGAPGWAVSAARFDRTDAARRTTAADDPAGIWKAQDAGFDPTVGPDGSAEESLSDPDVHFEDRGDTMGANNTGPDPRASDRTVTERRGPTRRPASSPE